ncbi:hypothetical protein [Streptomyces sp. NPDC050538]|uniref:hypothetical protein n=1 Tax=Streptomyces sp. NPDC050538 TaxID=3365627 RepID=UPI0037A50BAA
MPSGYVSGRVEVRPVRVGLVVTPGGWDSLYRAVNLAVSTWGGQGFPIFMAQDEAAVLREATALGVDVLYAVDDGAAAVRLAGEPGFRWGSFEGRSPFLRDGSGIDDHLLPASALFGWYAAHRRPSTSPSYVTWDPAHPLARLLTVWFGEFGIDAAQQTDRAAWQQVAEPIELGSGLVPPVSVLSTVDQLSVTLEEIVLEPRWRRKGIVIVDPNEMGDLVAWWNLRACGHRVIPWCEEHAEVLAPIVRQWGEQIAAEQSSADRPTEFSVWCNTVSGISPGLADIVRDARIRLVESDNALDVSCFGPMATRHTRQFSIDFDPSRGEVSVPLPLLDFLPRRSSWSGLGRVAADVEVWSDSGLPTGTRFTALAARRVAAVLPNFLEPFIRPRHRGFVSPVRVSSETASLQLIHAEPLVSRLLAEAGFTPRVGENGRRMHHRIELLGTGRSDGLANQPAVREVVRKVLRCRDGINADALVGHARKHAGDWTHVFPHWRGPYRDYASAVVGVLGSLGILQPEARITCLACGSAIRVPPESLGEAVVCELCGTSLPLAAYIANDPGRPMAWQMRATSAFDEGHLNETVPVMAALSVFASLFEPGFSNAVPLHLVGVELTKGADQREIDLVVLAQDAELPVVIIGEAKAGHPQSPKPGELLSVEDIEFLEVMQDAIRAIGIDCWIVFATSRPNLQQSEIELLRRSCERALTPVFDFGGRLLEVLPIVLTGQSLSVPSMDARHPARYAHEFPHLPALGRETCIRELGLVEIDFEGDESGQWHARPRWPENPATASPSGESSSVPTDGQ